jgi:hypothetical protein
MNGIIWTIMLSLTVTLLFLLPMLPALSELYWPRDNKPLRVVREFDGNIANFALGFDGFIESELGGMLRSMSPESFRHETLSSGEPCIVLGKTAELPLTEGAESTLDQMVIGSGNLNLPGNIAYLKEVYASGDFSCGSQTILRAILSHGLIQLAQDSAILRWSHARGELIAEQGVQMFGRASSDSGMKLADGVVFERLYAPRIAFGDETDRLDSVFLPDDSLTEWLPDSKTEGNRWRLKKDTSMPPGHLCKATLIAQGSLYIGNDCRMTSAIKSKKDLMLGDRCRCDDAIIAGAHLETGEGCRISGPLISESSILLRRGCIVGSADKPTTVSAPQISIEPGAIVFGTIWARERGAVEKQS